jgi:uncharacterized protein with PIN domain
VLPPVRPQKSERVPCTLDRMTDTERQTCIECGQQLPDPPEAPPHRSRINSEEGGKLPGLDANDARQTTACPGCGRTYLAVSGAWVPEV